MKISSTCLCTCGCLLLVPVMFCFVLLVSLVLNLTFWVCGPSAFFTSSSVYFRISFSENLVDGNQETLRHLLLLALLPFLAGTCRFVIWLQDMLLLFYFSFASSIWLWKVFGAAKFKAATLMVYLANFLENWRLINFIKVVKLVSVGFGNEFFSSIFKVNFWVD